MIRIWDPNLKQPIWWALLLAGAILGSIVTLIPNVYQYATSSMRHSPIEGRWNSYHVTFKDSKNIIIHSIVEIKKSIMRAYEVSYNEDIAEKLIYQGTIREDGNDYILEVNAVDHVETVSVRFPKPLGTDPPFLYGLWLAHDHERTPACGGLILSKKEIDGAVIQQSIVAGFNQQYFKFSADKLPIIRLLRR